MTLDNAVDIMDAVVCEIAGSPDECIHDDAIRQREAWDVIREKCGVGPMIWTDE